MSRVPEPVEDPQHTPPARLVIDVAVTDDATSGLMVVRVEPPDGDIGADAAGEAMSGAMAALAGAGIVHGIDGDAMRAALDARDGVARPVAHATPPIPPRHGRNVFPLDERTRADALLTGPAGTVIARQEPAGPGTAGVDVLGRPIMPEEPRTPELEAGPGTRLVEGADGVQEVHSVEDGRPKCSATTAAVETTVRTQVIRPAAVCRIHGTLVVQGDVEEGARVCASGSLVVGGIVAQAEARAEAGVSVSGACVGSEVRAGARRAASRRLLTALDRAVEELALLDAAAAQLVGGSAATARPLAEDAAMRILLERRFDGLPGLWTAAAGAMRADGQMAGVATPARGVPADVADRLASLSSGGAFARADIASARSALEADLERLRSAAPASADVRAAYLQACVVEAAGNLIVTGSGTYNTHASVEGDRLAEGPGATVRGGAFHGGGAVKVAELGAPGEARVLVELTGPARPGVRLSAALAHPGVEIIVAGRELRLERTMLNLTVGCDEENRVVRTGESTG